ncbi:DUF6600 domain-containing protein [Archangium sp.]|uniref:DUF6600 domain-containing protein n=1 Tax=Archangium sp. TaxID=1872627 RepID=UPI003899DE03
MGSRSKSLPWLLAMSGLCTLVSVGATGCIPPEGEEAWLQSESSGLTVGQEDPFYETLAPYGQWVHIPQVGRAWRPFPSVVGPDFVPYATGGQWVSSDEGWTFQTNWSWGWATFHYGRWFLSPEFGWVWVPGSDWAPAWVDWRWGGGYVGWAPLPPPVFVVEPVWSFVPVVDFCQPEVFRYRLPPGHARRIYPRTEPVPDKGGGHGEHWNRGPDPFGVARDLGRPLPRTTLFPPPIGEPPRPPPARQEPPPAPPSPPPSQPGPAEKPPHPPQPREAPPPPRPSHEKPPPPSKPEHHEEQPPPPSKPGHHEEQPPAPPVHEAPPPSPRPEPDHHEEQPPPPSKPGHHEEQPPAPPVHEAPPPSPRPEPEHHEAPPPPPPVHETPPPAPPPRSEPEHHEAPPPPSTPTPHETPPPAPPPRSEPEHHEAPPPSPPAQPHEATPPPPAHAEPPPEARPPPAEAPPAPAQPAPEHAPEQHPPPAPGAEPHPGH